MTGRKGPRSSAGADFYERLGYTVFGELADYPPGYTRTFLKKSLR